MTLDTLDVLNDADLSPRERAFRDEVRRFYAEHLGGTVRSQSPNAVFMDVGAQWVALFGPGTASTGFAPTPPGVDHISFQPRKERTFEERTRALQERGLDPKSPPGSGRVYFKDPDGVILQLS